MPSITVRMVTPTTLNELSDGTIDGAFFFEIDDNINIRHESLISEQIIPIASPSLSKEISKMKFRIPEAQWRLLGVDAPSWRNDWERFFRTEYNMAAPAPRITWLSSPLAALQAAVDGLGIALMFPSIMREELSTNRIKVLPGFGSTALVRQVNFYTMSEFPETKSMRTYLDWLRPRLTSDAIG
ncbi:substrate-binding domain-containing protein [Nguyenibacter vanlangensis]|uniref:Substrate-binding domain-containing protein n=1 Tax=Nguyenibacter vanlangensis TaxID=1216886 RepID=A0A7Y7M743_9PROT|nr:substrate-binding domain-containing protein [Nguyenibacter vanlangensis]